MEPTDNNHLQFGRLPEDENTFVIQCGPLSRAVLKPIEEATIAARKIAATAGSAPLKLCLSGGIDSACMLEAFLLAKVPFQAIFLRFKNSLNHYDIATNLDLCEKNNVRYDFIDLDVISFFESGKHFEYCANYECQSPQIAVHLWLLDQVEGYPVMGGNPIAPVFLNEKWYFVGLPGELHCTYFKYFYTTNRPGVPMFFLYHPELIASFFSLSCMQSFVRGEKKLPDDYSYAVKCASYQEGGFSAKPRLDKYTGFELVRKHYDEIMKTVCGMGFDQRFRKPLEEKFPFPENYFQLIPSEYFAGVKST